MKIWRRKKNNHNITAMKAPKNLHLGFDIIKKESIRFAVQKKQENLL